MPHFLPLYATLEDALDQVTDRPPFLRDELRLAPTATAPAAARLYVRDVLQYWRLALPDGEVIDRAELLADELVTNAVLHARTSLRLRLELRGDILHIGVHDASPRLLRLVASDPESETGRGLRLVEQLATAWGVSRRSDGGKVVWCTLRLWPRPGPAAESGAVARPRPTAQASASRRARCSSTSKSALGQASFMSSSCSTSRLGDRPVAVPLAVGRDPVPGGGVAVAALQGGRVRLLVVGPVGALVDVARVELPELGRVVEPGQQPLALLLLGDVQEHLDHADLVGDQPGLEAVDGWRSAGSRSTSAPGRARGRRARPRSGSGRTPPACPARAGACGSATGSRGPAPRVVGALKEAIAQPWGSTWPMTWRTTPPLPEVSMPWRTSSRLRDPPLTPSACSRSWRSDSRGPSAASSALPAALSPSKPGVARVSSALRSTGPAGTRSRSETRAAALELLPMRCLSSGDRWPASSHLAPCRRTRRGRSRPGAMLGDWGHGPPVRGPAAAARGGRPARRPRPAGAARCPLVGARAVAGQAAPARARGRAGRRAAPGRPRGRAGRGAGRGLPARPGDPPARRAVARRARPRARRAGRGRVRGHPGAGAGHPPPALPGRPRPGQGPGAARAGRPPRGRVVDGPLGVAAGRPLLAQAVRFEELASFPLEDRGPA